MNEWKKYIGSDEQIAEMVAAKNGWIWGDNKKDRGGESEEYGFPSGYVQENMTRYFIIPEDPLREIKMRQALTCQPVWVRYCINAVSKDYIEFSTNTPDWNIPKAEYRFTPFEEAE